MGFLTFLKKIFKREPKEIIEDEEHSLVHFPSTELYPQRTPAPPSLLSERESSIILTANTQVHPPKPPTAPPRITITPPSKTTIPYRGALRQEDLNPSQIYPPELRCQVDDEILGDVPSTPLPPYTMFAPKPCSVEDLVHAPPHAGTHFQTGHNVQVRTFFPAQHHHLSRRDADYNHTQHLHNGPPPPRDPRNPQSEQPNQLHSPHGPRTQHLHNGHPPPRGPRNPQSEQPIQPHSPHGPRRRSRKSTYNHPLQN